MLPILFQLGPINIGPIHIAPFPVHSWGVLLMIGFLLGGWRAAKNAGRYGFKPEDVWDVSLFGLLGGVLGGRLGFVVQEPRFWERPGSMLAIWDGGMAFYGGLLGGILAGVITCRIKKMRVADMADLAAPSLALGYIFGRIGCFLNGCCYGGVCDLPWAMRFADEHAPGVLTPPSHPAQLYSSIAGLLIFLALLPLEKHRKFRGQIMYVFLFLYGLYRFLIEYVRSGASSDSGITHLGITDAQVFSLLLSFVAAGLYMVYARRGGGVEITPRTDTDAAPIGGSITPNPSV